MKKKILLVTNGYSDSWDTVDYAIWLAKTFSMSITFLGVIENTEDDSRVQEMFSEAISHFQLQGIKYELQLVNGNLRTVLRKIKWDGDELLIIGTLGRSNFHHLLMRRTIHQVIEDVPVPILYARKVQKPIKNILVCLGGIGRALEVAKLSVEIAIQAQAQLTFLHVVPPVDLNYPVAKKIVDNWDSLLDTDTPPAQELHAAIKHAKEKGVPANTIVRHGNIVQQILEEVSQQEYDLICMGSPFSSPDNLRRMYAPNITAEIAESVTCPILTARTS